jgi:uncharacterized protein YhfF
VPLLIRKISKAKWVHENYDGITINDVQADAITSCLRTIGNTLSVWEINDMDRIQDVILALLLTGEHIATVDVVAFEKELLQKEGFTIDKTPGNCTVDEINKNHRNIIELNHKTLTRFAELILDKVSSNDIIRKAEGVQKDIVRNAIGEGRVKASDFSQSIRDKINA